MSFSWSTRQEAVADAIEKAASKKIVLFAAASNKGLNGTGVLNYPASSKDVIPVFSSNLHGLPSMFNPPDGNFYTLGEELSGPWARNNQNGPEPECRQTGTSFATPVMAALGAIALQYIRFRRRPSKSPLRPKRPDRSDRAPLRVFNQNGGFLDVGDLGGLKGSEGMRILLKLMAKSHSLSHKYDYISPGFWLSPPGDPDNKLYDLLEIHFGCTRADEQ